MKRPELFRQNVKAVLAETGPQRFHASVRNTEVGGKPLQSNSRLSEIAEAGFRRIRFKRICSESEERDCLAVKQQTRETAPRIHFRNYRFHGSQLRPGDLRR